jgi:hypothetical protein
MTGDDMSDAKEVKKGGFGQFEANYRDRWAARHPDAGLKVVPVTLPDVTTPVVVGTAPDQTP